MANVSANIIVDINTIAAQAKLKSLAAQITNFNRSVSYASGGGAQKAAALNRALADGINGMGDFKARVVPVATSVERFTTALEGNKMSLGQYTKYAASQVPGLGKMFRKEWDMMTNVATDRVKKMQSQYIELGKSAKHAQQALQITPTGLRSGYATDVAVAAQRSQIFNKIINDGSTKMLNWGKNTQWAGRQLMVGFSIPLAALGAVAAKTFMELDKASVSFTRVYGDLSTSTKETYKNLEAMKELGNEYTKYGIAVKDTLDLASRVAATGATGADLAAATEQTLRFATLGQIDYNLALEATISLQTAFGVSSDKLAENIDYLNAVENQTVLTIEDMATAIPTVATVVEGLGGDVKDLAVFMTAMKEGGISAQQGANALKSGLARLFNPTKAATEQLAKYGISIKEMVSSNRGDLMGLVQDFGKALSSLDDLERQQTLEKVFGKFQYARIGALFKNMASDSSQASRAIDLSKMSLIDLAKLSEKELSTIEESTTVKFKKAMETLKVSIAPLGEAFLKGLMPIIDVLTKIGGFFNDLPDPIKTAIAVVVGAVAGIGPVILMTVGLMANGFANIVKLIQVFRKSIAGIKGDASAFGYLASAELEAMAASEALEKSVTSLTTNLLLQRRAVTGLIREYERYSIAAGLAGAGVAPRRMGGARGSPRAPRPPMRLAGGVTGVPGRGNKDTIPALLTPGESVITKKATQAYGPILQQMNDGTLPGFAGGLMPGVQLSHAMASKVMGYGRKAAQSKQILQLSDAIFLAKAGASAQLEVLGNLKLGLPKRFNQDMRTRINPRTGKRTGKGSNKDSLAEHVLSEDLTPHLFSSLDIPEESKKIFRKELSDALGLMSREKDLVWDDDFAKAFELAEKATVRKLIDKGKPEVASRLASILTASREDFETRIHFSLPPAAKGRKYKGDKEAKAAAEAMGLLSEDMEPFYYNTSNRKPAALIYNPATKNYVQILQGQTRKLRKGSSWEEQLMSADPNWYERNIQNKNTGGSIFESQSQTRVPGMGNKDTVPAMLTPGEFVINKKATRENLPLINSINDGSIANFGVGGGVFLGKAHSFSNVLAAREKLAAAKQKQSLLRKEAISSSDIAAREGIFADLPLTDLGPMKERIGGRSSSFGMNGIYGAGVFKASDNPAAALAEVRGAKMSSAFGLSSPDQKLVKIRDPGDGGFIVGTLSKFDQKFAKTTRKFSEDSMFDQILGVLYRRDLDTQADNLYSRVVADVSQARYKTSASTSAKIADPASILDFMPKAFLQQAAGAKKWFMQETANFARQMTPMQYSDGMEKAMLRARSNAKKTTDALPNSNAAEKKKYYEDLIKDLDDLSTVNWKTQQEVHSSIFPSPAKKTKANKSHNEGLTSFFANMGGQVPPDLVQGLSLGGTVNMLSRKSHKAFSDFTSATGSGVRGIKKSIIEDPAMGKVFRSGFTRSKEDEVLHRATFLDRLPQVGEMFSMGPLASFSPKGVPVTQHLSGTKIQQDSDFARYRLATAKNENDDYSKRIEFMKKSGIQSYMPETQFTDKVTGKTGIDAWFESAARRTKSNNTLMREQEKIIANYEKYKKTIFEIQTPKGTVRASIDDILKSEDRMFMGKPVSEKERILHNAQIKVLEITSEGGISRIKGTLVSSELPGYDRLGRTSRFGPVQSKKISMFNEGVLMAGSGKVPGTGSKDTIPALLTPGESVITKEASAKYGPILNAMNRGAIASHATGTVAAGRPQGRMARAAARIPPGAGMGASMGIGMASMLPMMMQNEEGKFMGMDAGAAMGGMVGLSILPTLLKPAMAHPVIAGVVVAAAAVGAGLMIWRKSIDNAAKKSAEFGANIGGTSNALNNMSKMLGLATPAQQQAKMSLGFTASEQEASYGQFQPMLESETGQ